MLFSVIFHFILRPKIKQIWKNPILIGIQKSSLTEIECDI